MSDLALYTGALVHRRLAAPAYRFRYRTFTVLADIDRLDEAAARRRWFSHNRFNLVALYDRDHGPADGGSWRDWVESVLAGSGIRLGGGTIRLLCYPRVLGYVFNPLSLWFCHRSDGTLVAVIAEVHNTFGDRHCYLLHDEGRPLRTPVRDRHAKVFHVSPFLPVAGQYRFRIEPPGERSSTVITYHRDPDGPATLVATERGYRRPATDAALLRVVAAMPLMTVKVLTAIHWQALKIWARGGRLHRRPEPPAEEVTR
ncbi:DUF1365 domain-containing protein [Arhodomonas sp. SL1]|uniref:DUF1365 domain-containing protein n=1 Tax=Arhodomonas sp. SL1 TaxID=3425691 RepID=UPI003F88481F